MSTNQGAVSAPKLALNLLTREHRDSRENLRLEKLLNEGFRIPEGSRYWDDFPVWDPAIPVMGRKIYTGYFGADLVGSVSIRVADYKATKGTLKVAILGGVVTDSKLRGKGIASTLIAEACRWAELQGASAILLWGSEFNLYQKFGFELSGRQVRVPLEQLGLAPKFDTEFKIMTGWNPKIFELMMRREKGLSLIRPDRVWMQAHKNVHWWWIGKEDEPHAYAALGRGIDLDGLVHEWGGDPGILKILLGHLHAIYRGVELMGLPEDLAYLGIPYDEAKIEYLAMIKVIKPELILEQFGKDRRKFYFHPRDLFGPGEHSLNLPLWIWGLDSA